MPLPDNDGEKSTTSPVADSQTDTDAANASVADSSTAGTPDTEQSAGETWLEDYSKELRESLDSVVSADGDNAGDDADNPDDDSQAAAEGEQDAGGEGADDPESGKPEDEENADKTEDEQDKPDSDADADKSADDDEVSPDEDLPFNKHPRFRKLIAQRNDLKAEREQLQGRVEQFEPKATEFDNIQQFMQDNELQPQDVAEGFRIMALMSQDPVQAREALVQHLNTLDQFTGHKLPDDLQRQVDDGLVTEDIAREMAQLRNQRSMESQRSQRQIEQQREQAEQARQAQTNDQQRNAINDWESRTAQRDPDYERKQPLVAQQMRLLVMEQPPSNADEAVKLAKQAYDNVNRWVEQNMPKREEVRPAAKSDESVTSSSAERSPNSMQDAIRAAIEQG